MLKWIVVDRQAQLKHRFSRMFQDSPGVSLPFESRSTIRRHLFNDFSREREELRDCFHHDCISVSLSIDVWTSANYNPVLGMVDHGSTKIFSKRKHMFLAAKLQVPGVSIGIQRASRAQWRHLAAAAAAAVLEIVPGLNVGKKPW